MANFITGVLNLDHAIIVLSDDKKEEKEEHILSFKYANTVSLWSNPHYEEAFHLNSAKLYVRAIIVYASIMTGLLFSEDKKKVTT